MPSSNQTSVIAERLRVATGFEAAEHAEVIERLSSLDRRLSRYPAESVQLEISVKERGGADQHVTLECWIGGMPHLAARSGGPDVMRAVQQTRDELARQLGDLIDKRTPAHNRHLREV